MDIEHNQHIGIYHNAFSKDFCELVIKFYETNKTLSVSRNEIQPENKTMDKKDKAICLPYYDSGILMDSDLHQSFTSTFYGEIYPLYAKEYENIQEAGQNFNRTFKIQKTKPSEGYHVWHSEYGANAQNRIAVWSLYLNDDFEGGETEFLYQSMRVKPQTGTVTIFPASYTHVHRGNPPIGGNKYIATGWLTV